MSNLGQVALVVVGTVVGYEVGYPQLGFVLGSLAGSVLFPTQLPHGPQISDNRTTTATVGDPVSIVFGTADVAGTVIWLAPYVQSTNESSSKGGPQQTTYQYNQSIAIGLCEGPIGTLLRVWENGTIVYDIRPQQAANIDLNLLAETDLEYSNRLTVSADYAETFTLYVGTETQEADPTIESIQGYGQVPAFRGLAYIVYPNRLLQTGQGWRHPSFRFEVAAQGTGDCSTESQYSNEVLYPWIGGGTTGDPTNPLNANAIVVNGFDPYAPRQVVWPPANHGNTWASVADANSYLASFFNVSMEVFIGAAIDVQHGATIAGIAGAPVLNGQYQDPDPKSINLHFNWVTPTQKIANFPGPSDPLADEQGAIFYAGDAVWKITTTCAEGAPALGGGWTQSTGNCGNGWPRNWYGTYDTQIQVTRYPTAPPPICAGLTRWSQDNDYAVLPNGQLVRCDDWARDTSGTYYWALQDGNDEGWTGSSGIASVTYPLNPVLPVSSGMNTAAFWNAAYEAAVANGSIKPGKSLSPKLGGPSPPSSVGQYPQQVQGMYTLDQVTCVGSSAGVTIGGIIAAVCARAGLLNIETADMDSISIPGYSISTVTSGSSILQPLRSVAFFDAIESQGYMRFLARGKPIVATLTTDDIGAYDVSGGGQKQVPPSISTVRAQDEDLPRSIRLKYKAVSRDYEEGEQDSPFRLATQAVNDVDVSLALCLGDTQALQAAQVIWADAWAARTSYTVSIDQSWLALDCGDCIGVPVDGVLQRMRIVTDSNASGVLRKLSCVKDDGGAYISFAIASAPQRQAQVLSFIGPSTFELMDLPCLVDTDSDPGFYIAAQRQAGGGKWGGSMIYQSLDGGITYVQEFAITTEATYGTLRSAVPASEAVTWDAATVIDVAVPNSTVTFESRTDAAVIAGANAVAIGADGRWEILQFATATQVSATEWQLTRLLRGRRGTEHVMGTSQVGDAVVLVSTGDLQRLILQQSQVGATLGYKAVSLGAAYATGINQTFAGHAQALVPFSPIALAASGQSNGDVILTWIRRGRLGRTLTSGADIPLSEATEAYQVDIYSGAGAVLRTLAATAQTVTYPAAEQLADFAGVAPSEIAVAVYQMSAIVGRGTPAKATLTIAHSA